MESRLHGVPISATQMAPKAAPSYSKTSGIRAPLTVDESDFEFSVSSKSRRNSTTSSYYSGSEFESEDFESGEDELETVSERVHVVDQDEEMLEETHVVKEFALSEPFVRSPDETFGQEGGNVSENAVFRPFVRIPDERIYKGSSNVDDSDDSKSFLSESGDELVEDERYGTNYRDSRPVVAVLDEEVLESGPTSIVDIKIPPVQKLHIPIAQISADSDDDSRGSDGLDDEGFSGIVRIPSIEVLHRINSAPKVRMLEADEGDDYELQTENIVEMEFVEDFAMSNVVLGPSDEEHIGVENSISAVMIQGEGPDIDKEATTNSLVLNEELDSKSESGQSQDLMHVGKEIQKIDVIDDLKNFVELVDHREPTDLAEGIVFPESISVVASDAEPRCLCGGVNLTESDTVLEDNRVLNHDNESEKVESESEQEIDQTVESFSSNAADKVSSVHRCVDIMEVPAEWYPELPELPEALTESMQVNMSDNLSKDSSLTGVINVGRSVFECSKLDQETRKEAESDRFSDELEQTTIHCDTKAVVTEMTALPDSTSFPNGEILVDHLGKIDGQFVTDFREEMDADGGIIDPSAVAAFFEAIRGGMSDDSVVKLTSVDGMDNFSLESNSADLSSFSSTRLIISARNSGNFVHISTNGELKEALSEREKKIEKIQQIRVKYLCLLHRLHRSPTDSVASQVLNQLTLAAESSSSQPFHLNSAMKAAMELEAQRNNDLEFSLCILVIGKTGVGKSATINSIFGERKAVTDAFEPATTHVKEIIGTINGVKLKVFDTPGLRTSSLEQSINRKILSSIKKLMQKSPPDIILYVDRLDTQTSNLNDLPLLKTVSSFLGSSIWRKSIVAFTHGTSIPPNGSNGYPLSYEEFVAQQSRVIQQLISHSAEELLLMNPDWTIPICLVENHPFSKKNEDGETLLHNGESWRSQLLLSCYSMKILSELRSVVGVENSLDLKKCPLSLSCFVSSFLQSNVCFKQFSVGGISELNVAAALNNRLCGQICIKTSSSDQLQIAALPLSPIARAILKKIFRRDNEDYST